MALTGHWLKGKHVESFFFFFITKPFDTELLTLIVQTWGRVCTKPLAELTVTLACFHSLHPNKSAARTLLVWEQRS